MSLYVAQGLTERWWTSSLTPRMDKVSAGFLLASSEHCKNFVTDVAVEGPKIVITTRQTLGEVCVAPHLMSKKKTGQQQKKTRGTAIPRNLTSKRGWEKGWQAVCQLFSEGSRKSDARTVRDKKKRKKEKRKKLIREPTGIFFIIMSFRDTVCKGTPWK
jgi:hypothetical protein